MSRKEEQIDQRECENDAREARAENIADVVSSDALSGCLARIFETTIGVLVSEFDICMCNLVARSLSSDPGYLI